LYVATIKQVIHCVLLKDATSFMAAKILGSGTWKTNGEGLVMTNRFHKINEVPSRTSILIPVQNHNHLWSIGQIVDVRPRTWAG
jgi:hypothetical protein